MIHADYAAAILAAVMRAWRLHAVALVAVVHILVLQVVYLILGKALRRADRTMCEESIDFVIASFSRGEHVLSKLVRSLAKWVRFLRF